MRISNRLMAIYEEVNAGETVADVGTDHGYVPLLLYRNGISPDVIMCDISEGSMAKAIDNFEMHGISIDKSHFRVGDGLSCIAYAEVNDVIIAGLGGRTIEDILSSDLEKTQSFQKLILQPRNNCGELRHWLFTHGFNITRENLAAEGKFVCEIITAEPSEVQYREPPYPRHDIRWKYPKAFKDCDYDLLSQRLTWKIQRLHEQIESLSRSAVNQQNRIEQINNDLRYLNSLWKNEVER